MDEDFGTPEAVAVLFDLASEINRSKARRSWPACCARWAGAGLLQADPASFLKGSGSAQAGRSGDPALIAERAAAKAAKNFAEADRIRQGLLEQGVVLKDSPRAPPGRRR
jgi:cysteinyl-tRNA synthetase